MSEIRYFTPIKQLPSNLYPWWISSDPGYPGINPCYVMNSTTGSVLPNCTGWAWGAFAYHCNMLTGCELPGDRDAVNWYNDDRISYERGQEPKLGAVLCMRNTGAGSGHVAIVEEIADDGSYIWCSESNWEHWNYPFRYVKRYRNRDWNNNNDDNPDDMPGSEDYEWMVFQGFIYAPYNFIKGGEILPIGGKRNVRKRTIFL